MELTPFLACVLLVAGCRADTPATRARRAGLLQSRLESLVPAPFTDCGHATPVTAPVVLSCAQRLIAAKTPFVASFPQQGIDSEIVFGLASSEPGNVLRVWFDGDPSGGGHVGARIQAVEPCPEPHFNLAEGLVIVSCR